ncbi:uncharacterized protein LOC132610451 [Lycium barbarum]|uniref:uncharacterized protein LOC132610451 n=1 Tax=Lycium barbarum TaxID=112863 RepID=UPI00293EEB51|nr:uncharacterized protein LOC132610451 [Lycium barbarum]
MSNKYFLHDMVIKILLNLPVKPLVKFKLVCKSWRSLIEDRQFIKQHRDRCQHDVNCHKILLASWKRLPRCDDFEGKMVVDDDGFVYMSTYEYASNKSIIQCMCLKNENFEEISFPDAGVKNPVLFIAGENLLLMNETIDSLVLYKVYDSKRQKLEKARIEVLEQVKADVLESSQPYFGQEYVALACVETLISPNAL